MTTERWNEKRCCHCGTWDMVASTGKWTICPQSWCVKSRKMGIYMCKLDNRKIVMADWVRASPELLLGVFPFCSGLLHGGPSSQHTGLKASAASILVSVPQHTFGGLLESVKQKFRPVWRQKPEHNIRQAVIIFDWCTIQVFLFFIKEIRLLATCVG